MSAVQYIGRKRKKRPKTTKVTKITRMRREPMRSRTLRVRLISDQSSARVVVPGLNGAADASAHIRRRLRVVCGLLFLSSLGQVEAVTQGSGAYELLHKADTERTANYPRFASTLEEIEKQRSALSASQREYLSYLEAWKSAYDGDGPTALARLTTLIDNSKDPTLRLRAGSTAVNMLVFGRRYEEAFSHLSNVLNLLPQVSDGEARQQALLNAAELYKSVGQYDLSLSYAQ